MPKYWVKNYFAHGRFPEVGQKQKTEKKKNKENTPGTAGGPGGRDRTLAVAKNLAKMTFFSKKIKFTICIYLLSHMGVSPKWVKSKRR